jgi:hypothetical protein
MSEHRIRPPVVPEIKKFIIAQQMSQEHPVITNFGNEYTTKETEVPDQHFSNKKEVKKVNTDLWAVGSQEESASGGPHFSQAESPINTKKVHFDNHNNDFRNYLEGEELK